MGIDLLYTGDIFRLQRFGGISRYFSKLIDRVSRDEFFDVRVDAFLHINTYLKFGTNTQTIIPTYINTHDSRISRVALACDALKLKELRRSKYDIIHETFFSSDQKMLSGKVRFVTVYDFIRERFSPGSNQIQKKSASIRRADHIICISSDTQKDLLDLYGIDEEKTTVIYLGIDFDELSRPISGNHPMSGITSLLYIGQRAGYKNFDFVLNAFKASKFLRQNFCLNLIGPKLTTEEMCRIESLGLKNTVFYSGQSEISRLLALKSCQGLIVPSLYEGFGLPGLEALAAGKLVFSSGSGAQKEILAESASYFDPHDFESLETILKDVFEDSLRVNHLRVIGRERAQQFSWSNTANQTMELYRRILNC